jgi:hypothetical protein
MKESIDPANLESALKKLTTFKEKHFGELPDLKWATHKTTLEAQTAMVKTYSEKMIKDLLIDRKIFNIVNKPKDAARYIQRNYPYPEELAYRSIQTAANVLKRLNF